MSLFHRHRTWTRTHAGTQTHRHTDCVWVSAAGVAADWNGGRPHPAIIPWVLLCLKAPWRCGTPSDGTTEACWELPSSRRARQIRGRTHRRIHTCSSRCTNAVSQWVKQVKHTYMQECMTVHQHGHTHVLSVVINQSCSRGNETVAREREEAAGCWNTSSPSSPLISSRRHTWPRTHSHIPNRVCEWFCTCACGCFWLAAWAHRYCMQRMHPAVKTTGFKEGQSMSFPEPD